MIIDSIFILVIGHDSGNEVTVLTQQELFPKEYPEDPSGIHINVYENRESGFSRRLESHLRKAGTTVMAAEYF